MNNNASVLRLSEKNSMRVNEAKIRDPALHPLSSHMAHKGDRVLWMKYHISKAMKKILRKKEKSHRSEIKHGHENA